MIGNQQFMTVNESFFTKFLVGDFNYFPGVYSKQKLDELHRRISEEKASGVSTTAKSKAIKLPANLIRQMHGSGYKQKFYQTF